MLRAASVCVFRSMHLLRNHALNCECEREQTRWMNGVNESVTGWASARDGGRKIGIETSKRSHNLGKYDIMLLFRMNTCYQIIQTCHNNVARCADKWHMLNCFSVLLIYGEFKMKTRVFRPKWTPEKNVKNGDKPHAWCACVRACVSVSKCLCARECFEEIYVYLLFTCLRLNMRECVSVQMRNVYVMCNRRKTTEFKPLSVLMLSTTICM